MRGFAGGTYSDVKSVQSYNGGYRPVKSIQRFQGGVWTSLAKCTVAVTQSVASLAEGASVTYTGQTGNRIHGSETAPSGTVSGYQCRDNTWSASADGAGRVVSNS